MNLFDVLPAELFIQVIFPQLTLEKAMLIKSTNKRCKELVDEYQQGYKEILHVRYNRLHLVEKNIPNAECVAMIYITNRVVTITSYKVLKHLIIGFIDADTSIYDSLYYLGLYKVNKTSVGYFDVSNLHNLVSLNIFDIPTNHKIPLLSTLVNLTELGLYGGNIDNDISTLTKLNTLYFVDIFNVTLFPEHLKLFKYHAAGRYMITTDGSKCKNANNE